MSFEDLEKAIREYHPSPNIALVKKAYNFASEKHKNQKRHTGEPYFIHLEQTALIACRLNLDEVSVCSALLHDCMEDQGVTHEELCREFNEEIADIVEGVTKISKKTYNSAEEAKAETYRKMLLAMAKDIRVILIKLCDRLHNMRTLYACTEEKQLRVSKETKDIYVPLANRLGIFWLKSELDDLCFFYTRPSLYKLIEKSIDEKQIEREEFITSTINEIRKLMEENGIEAKIKGRVKNIASLGAKMEKKNIEFSQIRDLLGFRIIVKTVRECYEALGLIHTKWTPIPKRFKDYIAMPKSNMYQSLHTLVKGPNGQEIELQIRTQDMDDVNEYGIAAHWKYKEGNKNQSFDLQWLKSLVDNQQYVKDPTEFIQSVKSELFPDEVFVFTPAGDVIKLPAGATPIDFAYAVHSGLGDRITGAKVNGGMVPLNFCLQSGDTVEVQSSKTQKPNPDWLFFVKSSKAKQKIKAYLRAEERIQAHEKGEEIITKELKKINININNVLKSNKLQETLQGMGFKSDAELFCQTGFNKVNLPDVISKLSQCVDVKSVDAVVKETPKPEKPFKRILEKASEISRQKCGIKINGVKNMVVVFAKCCSPIPGDKIIGFISRGRGVVVHHADCPEVQKLDTDRKVEVSWENEVEVNKKIKLMIYGQDRIGTMADISKIISDNGANIYSMLANVDEFSKAVTNVTIVIKSAKQLDKIIQSLQKVSGINRVEKVNIEDAYDTKKKEVSKKSKINKKEK